MRRLLAPTLVALALAAAAAGCGSTAHTSGQGGASAGGESATSTSSKLKDITNIEQLRAAFNAHSDQPRRIVLASPT